MFYNVGVGLNEVQIWLFRRYSQLADTNTISREGILKFIARYFIIAVSGVVFWLKDYLEITKDDIYKFKMTLYKLIRSRLFILIALYPIIKLTKMVSLHANVFSLLLYNVLTVYIVLATFVLRKKLMIKIKKSMRVR